MLRKSKGFLKGRDILKKVYEKPMMAVERYSLTQTIATCAQKIGFVNSQCVINDEDATREMKSMAVNNWFIQEGGCKMYPIGMDDEDGICYHTNANAFFTS